MSPETNGPIEPTDKWSPEWNDTHRTDEYRGGPLPEKTFGERAACVKRVFKFPDGHKETIAQDMPLEPFEGNSDVALPDDMFRNN